MKYFEILDDAHNIRLLGSMPSLSNARVCDSEDCDTDCPTSHLSRRMLSEEDFQNGFQDSRGKIESDATPISISEGRGEVADTVGCTSSAPATLCVGITIEEEEEEIEEKEEEKEEKDEEGGEEEEEEGEGEGEEEEGEEEGEKEVGGKKEASGGVQVDCSSMAPKKSYFQETEDSESHSLDSDSDDGIYDTPGDKQRERKLPSELSCLAMTTEFLADNITPFTKPYGQLVYSKEPVVNPHREAVCNAVMYDPGSGARFTAVSRSFQAAQHPQIDPCHQVSYAFPHTLTVSVQEESQAEVAVAFDDDVQIGCFHALQQIIPAELQRFSILIVALIKTFARQGIRRFSVAFNPPELGPGPPLLDTDPIPTAFGMPPNGLDTMAQGMPDLGMDTWATGLPPTGLETGAIGFPSCQGWA